jgi:hypothetical protein
MDFILSKTDLQKDIKNATNGGMFLTGFGALLGTILVIILLPIGLILLPVFLLYMSWVYRKLHKNLTKLLESPDQIKLSSSEAQEFYAMLNRLELSNQWLSENKQAPWPFRRLYKKIRIVAQQLNQIEYFVELNEKDLQSDISASRADWANQKMENFIVWNP